MAGDDGGPMSESAGPVPPWATLTSGSPRMFDLDSVAQSFFTWKTALSLALASDLAYQTGQAVENVATRNWRLQRCRFLSQVSTQCFVAHSDSAIVVAFRGTESLNDWVAN